MDLETANENFGHEGEPSSIQSNEKARENVGISSLPKHASAQNAIASISQQSCLEIKKYQQQLPFPHQFKKQKQDDQFKRLLDVLKKLHISIPLVEALEKMPTYVKFLKEFLTKKRRLGEFETVSLTESCSAILTNKIFPKLKDPGSFTIPISIGGHDVGRALCDLGASINLMPMSIFKKLGGEARPTTLTLQLADRSLTHPEGKIEDVLVKVYKFIFLVDFIILGYDEDREVPISLGRPFLATGRTLIDVERGELTMRAQDEQVTFKVLNPIRSPDELGECLAIGIINSSMDEKSQLQRSKKARERQCHTHKDPMERKEREISMREIFIPKLFKLGNGYFSLIRKPIAINKGRVFRLGFQSKGFSCNFQLQKKKKDFY
ncbi:uncharacterized protein LOC133805072 [Humulus lupulus]|uniref:uncharacterized protein LOC133805072 n=1 Tax=Humulus lupulus TaxID=3486 RepID=UPI002B410F5A|nr:uncharacterized protein LOC133805072 [Humulus lupulus]